MPAVNYLWDPDEDNIVKEFDDAGNTIADYTTEPFLYGDVVSQRRSGVSHFYHFDTQGNTTELTDINGNTTDTRRYSAFGETTESTGSTVFPFQYIGQEGYYRDSNEDSYLVQGRSYSQPSARWSSADPDSMPEALNPYVYARNNPLVESHPSGSRFVSFLPLPGPIRPAGVWRCSELYRMGSDRITDDSFEHECVKCTQTCQITWYGQRCFHESVKQGDDSDPTKGYTLVYVRFRYTNRVCGDKKLPDDEYQTGCESLWPLRLISGGEKLDQAIKKHVQGLDSCKDFVRSALCDALKEVPPAPPTNPQ